MDKVISFPGRRADEIRKAIDRTVTSYAQQFPGILSWAWQSPTSAQGTVKAMGRSVDAFCVLSDGAALVRVKDDNPMTMVLVTSFLMDLETKVKANFG